MQTARKIDANGFLTVSGCPISSYGIFDYSAGQIGLDGDPRRIVKVYRPREAISSKEVIESLKNLPLINDHEFLSGSDESITSPEEYGVDGITTSRVWFENPWLRADLKVFSRTLQRYINSGKIELSLGYDCDYILQPGIFEGQEYEVIQTNIRGNHLALVDVARVQGAKVLDSKDGAKVLRGKALDYMKFDLKNEVTSMPTKAQDNAVQELLAIIPALKEYLGEEAKEPAHQGEGEAATDENGKGAAEGGEAAGAAGEGNGSEGAEGAEGGAAAGEGAAEPAGSEAAGTEGAAVAKGGEAAGGEVAAGTEGGEVAAGAAAQVPALLERVKEIIGKLEAKYGTSGAGLDGEAAGATGTVAEDEVKPIKSGCGAAIDGEEQIMTKAADAALRNELAAQIRKDEAAKMRLYARVSPITGAFDCAEMDHAGVAQYSAKKLLGNAADSMTPEVAVAAIDAYLTGAATRAETATRAADSAEAGEAVSALDAYMGKE